MRLRARSYFDGERFQVADGPYLINLSKGVVASIAPRAAEAPADLEAAFVMPALVEAHSHIFLDGGELDFARRTAYLDAGVDEMMRVARENIQRCVAAGVTLVRDAGDRYGINDAIRAELAAAAPPCTRLRSPGLGVKRPKRYGGFMARDIASDADVRPIAAEVAAKADDVKIILTGIIDFAKGEVKGAPQFNVEELREIVAIAHVAGKKTFAHCSGLEGLETAVAAGVDSIEHGFFMTADVLRRMADRGLAWVPTFSPVHFQWARPELAGWSAEALGHLRRILDSHLEHVAIARRLGVELVAGSDAGSPGVVHGAALLDELDHFIAGGLSPAEALESATSRPRRLWGLPSADVKSGGAADFLLLERSPLDDWTSLRGAKRHVMDAARNLSLV